MKEQLYMDFKIDGCETREEFIATLEKYVDFYNNHRPCYAIGYDTPVNYRKRFYKGEMERKNTFESRILTEEPKFVQKRHKQSISDVVSTFENDKCKKLFFVSTFIDKYNSNSAFLKKVTNAPLKYGKTLQINSNYAEKRYKSLDITCK